MSKKTKTPSMFDKNTRSIIKAFSSRSKISQEQVKKVNDLWLLETIQENECSWVSTRFPDGDLIAAIAVRKYELDPTSDFSKGVRDFSLLDLSLFETAPIPVLEAFFKHNDSLYNLMLKRVMTADEAYSYIQQRQLGGERVDTHIASFIRTFGITPDLQSLLEEQYPKMILWNLEELAKVTGRQDIIINALSNGYYSILSENENITNDTLIEFIKQTRTSDLHELLIEVAKVPRFKKFVATLKENSNDFIEGSASQEFLDARKAEKAYSRRRRFRLDRKPDVEGAEGMIYLHRDNYDNLIKQVENARKRCEKGTTSQERVTELEAAVIQADKFRTSYNIKQRLELAQG